jgi:hypothetical protein
MVSVVRRAILFALATVFLSAGAALAASAPVKESFEFSLSRDFPAGTVCDFNYHEDVTGSGWDETFFDEAGNYVRDTVHLTIAVTHTNVDTGYVLTEVDHGSQTFVDATQTLKVVAIQWLLKDSTGRVVLAHAGLVIFDESLGEVTKVTPNVGGDFADELCPALGGNPA